MKAAFALLANPEVHNFVRRLTWEIHQKYRTDISACRLPPHISLKQPFEIGDLAALESYMDDLASTIEPFEVHLTELQLVPTVMDDTETGILWLDVQETEDLRGLHNRLNHELSKRFKNTQADFNGASYHFHMTLMIGGQPLDVYHKLFSEITNRTLSLRYTVGKLAMFVYDERSSLNADYITYKILSLGRV